MSAMPSYKPGSPCWISIPATNVPALKVYSSHLPSSPFHLFPMLLTALQDFYIKIFQWNFPEMPESYSSDKLALYRFDDPAIGSISGGIVQVPPECHSKGNGSVMPYYACSDIEQVYCVIAAIWTNLM